MYQAKNIVKGYFSTILEIGEEDKEDDTLLDAIYRRIEDPLETGVVIDESKSEIRQFYRDKVVLVTGATGSIGTSVIEKLLRTCPIGKLYILVRPKRGMAIEERMEKYFDDVFFELMKSTTMDWRDKVVPIAGELAMEGLGISSDDRSRLIEDTNVIIHLAANVKFNENLGKILRLNVFGTEQLLNIAQECRKLKSFLYVSTAYSQCTESVVEEKFYEPPISLEYARELISRDSESFTEEVTKALIQPFPNTYSFSKAVAEHMVCERSKGLVAGILRPSIGVPTYREPLKAWTNSFGGINYAGMFTSLGLLHVAYGNYQNKFDLVPLDFCSNAIIAAAWDLDKSYTGKPLVYNFAQTPDNLSTWKHVYEYAFGQIQQDPTLKAVWYTFGITINNYTAFRILDFFIHFLPALLVDFVLVCSGRRPRSTSMYRKGHEYLLMTLFYTKNSWRFDTTRTTALWEKLNVADKALFHFDRANISWELWGYLFWRAVRVYLLGDPMNTLSAARTKRMKLGMLHYSIVVGLVAIGFYVFWYVICYALGQGY